MAQPSPVNYRPLVGSFCNRHGATITPSDATVYNPPIMGFRVGGTAGDVAVVFADDELTDIVIIPSVQIGEKLPYCVKQIRSTGTSATGITGGF